MPDLLRHPLARFVAATAAVGSLADWVLFAVLVVTVDHHLGGGPWATALVLLARMVPGVVFAPIAARRVDRVDLVRTLGRHEALRVGAVLALAGGVALGTLLLVVPALLALEFAAAMQAAARESTISRHLPARLFTPMNTATAVLAYGMLPLGPAIVAIVGVPTSWVLAVTGYLALTIAYATALRLPAPAQVASPHADGVAPGAAAPGDWRRVTVAAAIGLLPAVALFALGPSFAHAWLDDRAATGPLYAAVLTGAAVGVAATNRRRVRADLAMLVAAGGLAVAALGAWPLGLALLGVGAGATYLDLQTRLQHTASDPSQFAAAFAVLKVASAAAVAGAPALAAATSPGQVLRVGVVVALAGAVLATPAPARGVQALARGVLRIVVAAVLRIEVVGHTRRVPGAAVVVSNHPHWLDGVVAMAADGTLRPIARRQRHLGARLGIWAARAVVTATPPPRPGTIRRAPTSPDSAFARAADHLRAGGRIWLAPEGGAHTEATLRPPRSGAVRMAALAGVPVQPLAIHWRDDPTGPDLARWRPWARRHVRVTWGEPILATGDVAEDNDRMMGALAGITGLRAPGPAPAAA